MMMMITIIVLIIISVQPHHSTRSSDVVTLARLLFSSFLTVNYNRYFRHSSPVSGITFLRNFASLPIMNPYYSHLISHISVRHFLHYHCHHPSLLSSSPGSKLISFPQILSSIVLLPFTHRTDFTDFTCFRFLGHVGFNFGTVC